MVALLSSRTSVREWPGPEGVADIPPQTVQPLGLDDEEEDDEGTEHQGVTKMAPSTDPSPPMMISLPPSPSCRSRRVPRESLDVPEDLPKEGSSSSSSRPAGSTEAQPPYESSSTVTDSPSRAGPAFMRASLRDGASTIRILALLSRLIKV